MAKLSSLSLRCGLVCRCAFEMMLAKPCGECTELNSEAIKAIRSLNVATHVTVDEDLYSVADPSSLLCEAVQIASVKQYLHDCSMVGKASAFQSRAPHNLHMS